MKFCKLPVLLLVFVLFGSFISRPSYRIYTGKGKNISFEELTKELAVADVVLFGELHNVSIIHWLQLEILKDIYDLRKKNLCVGAEFLESDNQIAVDEFLAGLFNISQFKAETKTWNNFDTDHAPLLIECKARNIPFVATNIPRRYANLVAREGIEGLEKLSAEALRCIVPLPFVVDKSLRTYKQLQEMQHAHHLPYMLEAQAIKDATMAHFIMQNQAQGKLFFHINGAYHSDYYEGIYWYIKQKNSQVRIASISCVEADNIEKVEKEVLKKADYIIVVPSNMTKTY
jgi:uncharacterized iron-regulated protein